MHRFAVATLLLSVAAAPATAQRLEPRPVPTGRVQSFRFASPSMGVTYSVNVGLPDGWQPDSTRKYPMQVTTDGDWAFPLAFQAISSLSGMIEPLFVVSIGTADDEGEAAHTRRRIYEFSAPWDLKDLFGQGVAEFCVRFKSPEGRCVGGAARFLNVIASELIPLIAAKFPVDTAQLGLFGISAGGHFAAWAMFQPNSPFKKYLISSPAMAYGDGDVFREEARYAADHKDLPVSVYLGAGVLEAGDPDLEGIGKIVSGMSHFAGVLGGRKYPGLKLTVEFHPGMSHVDVMGTSVVRGMRTLYSK